MERKENERTERTCDVVGHDFFDAARGLECDSGEVGFRHAFGRVLKENGGVESARAEASRNWGGEQGKAQQEGEKEESGGGMHMWMYEGGVGVGATQTSWQTRDVGTLGSTGSLGVWESTLA